MAISNDLLYGGDHHIYVISGLGLYLVGEQDNSDAHVGRYCTRWLSAM